MQGVDTNEAGKAQLTLEYKTTSFENFIASFENSEAELPKFDIVYLVQMLYYVKNASLVLGNAMKLLDTKGRLFLIHVSGKSGYSKVGP